MPLLEFTDKGIYCRQADVYLDPWKPVNKALITHGHSDHAREGHGAYLCTPATAAIIRHRFFNPVNIQTISFHEALYINGVKFSFHPAGHVPGSAQIRVEQHDEVWVFSGDYKLQQDNISSPFEIIKCHNFITESTFGLPVYKWETQDQVFADINSWWRKNKEQEKASIIAGYTLGKAQRILKNIDQSIGKIFVHGAVDTMNNVIRSLGVDLPETVYADKSIDKKDFRGALIVCPPSAIGSPWLRKFLPYSLGIASGWMKLRGARRRRGADRGFVLSDHADWDELNHVIKETGASKVFVTHGYAEVFSRWLNEQGIESEEIRSEYEGELEELAEAGGVTPQKEDEASDTNVT